MSILKLANAGDEATLNITGCEVVEGQYGEQVQFDAGPDRLYLPKSSADRQLERIGLDYEQTVGQLLHFSRVASSKPGSKPFWNIDTVTTNGKPAKKEPFSHANKPEKELPEFLRDADAQDNAELAAKVSGVDTAKLQKDLAVYEALTDWWLSTIAPKYVKSDIGCSPESGVAGVATLFIRATR